MASPIFSLKDVEALANLAAEAGAIILGIRAQHDAKTHDLGALAKADGSPVTRADHAAEAHILEGFLKLGLAAPYVAEETAAEADMAGISGFYLVDPLDGTKAFVSGGDDFTVNIGFVEKGVPVMGVVHVPVLNITYYSDGKTAYLRDAVGVRPITARYAPHEGFDVITNRTEDWSGRVRDYLAGFSVRSTSQLSSAHKLGLLAAGTVDMYPRFGPTFEWDIAAGDAILRAAGGSVRTLDGQPLGYGKPQFLNPSFVARGKEIIG